MLFAIKFKEIVGALEVPEEKRLWKRSFVFGCITYIIIFLLLAVPSGQLTLRTLNRSAAWTSVILIGLSFFLTSVCYFWNFADRFIVYRKHLGLMGFYFGALHMFLILFSLSKRVNIFNFFLSENHFTPFIFGYSALLIFTMMAFISNRYAAHELGGKRWRSLLRFGYIGLIFSAVHFALLNAGRWSLVGIVTLVFIFVVLLFRIALEISVRRKK